MPDKRDKPHSVMMSERSFAKALNAYIQPVYYPKKGSAYQNMFVKCKVIRNPRRCVSGMYPEEVIGSVECKCRIRTVAHKLIKHEGYDYRRLVMLQAVFKYDNTGYLTFERRLSMYGIHVDTIVNTVAGTESLRLGRRVAWFLEGIADDIAREAAQTGVEPHEGNCPKYDWEFAEWKPDVCNMEEVKID